MQFCKSCAKLKLFAINIERTVRFLFALYGIRRQAFGVDTQEVTYPSFFEFQESGNAVKAHDMDDILLDRTEDPLEHIIEVHSDVSSHPTRFVDIAFPRRIVPLAAGSDVGQIHVVDFISRSRFHFLFQISDSFMEPELENGISFVSRFLLQFNEVINIIWIKDKRFLTNDIRSEAQAIPNKGIVGIIGCTNRCPMERIVSTHLFGAEAVKLLILRKEGAIRETTIQPTDGIKLIIRHHKIISGISNGLNVSRSDISGGTNQRKIKFIVHFIQKLACKDTHYFAYMQIFHAKLQKSIILVIKNSIIRGERAAGGYGRLSL